MRTKLCSLRLRFGAIVCCGLLGVGTSSGSSIPLFGIDTYGYATAESDTGQSWNNGGFQQVLSFNQPLLTYTNSETIEGYVGSGTAEVSFGAQNGVLSAYAYDTASVSGLAYVSGSGETSFYGSWIDTITIGGLPTGTEVQLLLTNYLHADVTADGSVPVGYISSTLQLDTAGLGSGVGATPNEEISTSSTSDYASGTAIIDVFSGSSYQIEHQLVGVGGAVAGGSDALGSLVIVDALDTSASYIDVLTPGATYSTASGFDYASTPEPSTGVMACFGLVVAGWGVWKQRKRAT